MKCTLKGVTTVRGDFKGVAGSAGALSGKDARLPPQFECGSILSQCIGSMCYGFWNCDDNDAVFRALCSAGFLFFFSDLYGVRMANCQPLDSLKLSAENDMHDSLMRRYPTQCDVSRRSMRYLARYTIFAQSKFLSLLEPYADRCSRSLRKCT